MNLQSLYQLYDLGFSIFPLQPKSKRPTKGWKQYQEERARRDQLEQWIQDMPRMNVAVATGEVSGITVLDIDDPEAMQWLKDNGGITQTPTVKTGNGWQFYFKYVPELGNKAKVEGQAVDIRGDGGYVVAPPSIHPDGPEYTWIQPPLDIDFAEMPEWLVDILTKKEKAPKTTNTSQLTTNDSPHISDNYGRKIVEDELSRLSNTRSGRNHTLNEVTFSIFTAYYGDLIDISESELDDQIFRIAQSLDAYSDPGNRFTDSEIKATMESAKQAAKQNPRPKPQSNLRPVPTYKEKGGAAPKLSEEDQIDWKKKDKEDEIESFSYFVNEDGQMCYKGSEKAFPLADFQAYIIRQIEDEDGDREYLVEVTNPLGEVQEGTITAADFSNSTKLKSFLENLAGGGYPIFERRLSHINPGIHILSRQAGTIERYYRFNHTGWAEKEESLFLMPPGDEERNFIVDLPNRKLPYGSTASSEEDHEHHRHVLRTLIESMEPENTLPILIYLLGAPLSQKMGWRDHRYGLFIKGITGNLKTTFTQTAMCLYGTGFKNSKNLIKWGEGATTNALMSMATHIWDLPMLIDNYKPNTGGGQKALVAFIHSVMEGGEKHRLNRSAELKDTKEIYTWPIMTGEDVPDNDTAAIARLLVVEFNNTKPGWNKKLGEAGEEEKALNQIGSAWITWIAQQEPDFWKQYRIQAKKYIQHYQDQIAKHFPEMKNANRVAQNIALNTATFEVIRNHPIYGGVFDDYLDDYNISAQRILITMDETTKGSLEAQRFLLTLQELISSGKALLLDLNEPEGGIETMKSYEKDKQQQKMLGWHDEGYAYLLPAVSRKAVESMIGKFGLNDISQRQLYAQLNSIGAIAATDNGRVGTVQKKISGRNVRVIKIPLDQFQQENEEVTGTAVTDENPKSPF